MKSFPRDAVASQYAQCATIQEKIEFITGLFGQQPSPTSPDDIRAQEACANERRRLTRNWVRRQRSRAAKAWHQNGTWREWERQPAFPCTCGYHGEKRKGESE